MLFTIAAVRSFPWNFIRPCCTCGSDLCPARSPSCLPFTNGWETCIPPTGVPDYFIFVRWIITKCVKCNSKLIRQTALTHYPHIEWSERFNYSYTITENLSQVMKNRNGGFILEYRSKWLIIRVSNPPPPPSPHFSSTWKLEAIERVG